MSARHGTLRLTFRKGRAVSKCGTLRRRLAATCRLTKAGLGRGGVIRAVGFLAGGRVMIRRDHNVCHFVPSCRC